MESKHKQLIILVGVPGSGKSTYVKEHLSDYPVYSGDDYQIKLYGKVGLLTGEQKNNVYQRLLKDMLQGLGQHYDTVVYDATNLSRKTRKVVYDRFKNKIPNIHIKIIYHAVPLKVAQERNRRREQPVDEGYINRVYIGQDVPKLGLDCDEIKVVGSFNDFKEEFANPNDLPHGSPFHAETIQEHINLTIQNAPTELLKEVAEFHDLGKIVTRTLDTRDMPSINWYQEEVGPLYRYFGHERVSALYYLAYLGQTKQLNDPTKLLILEVIYQHMQGRWGITSKYLARHKLTDQELQLMADFQEIDNESRIVDEGVLNKYLELRDGSK